MKKKAKIFFTIFIICYLIYLISIIFLNISSYATSNSNSTSDVQLIARAINGEARGESYEGQVAVRCCNIKQSKKSKFSKYNSRSHLPTRSVYGSIRWANKYTNRWKINSGKSSKRCFKRMGPNKWLYILFQSKYCYKWLDLVKNYCDNNWKTSFL